ncbi:glutathione-regulated potassium-efflux system ancillary protein KefG [Arthrobacter oryzae]|uniref:NAD(P)H-dependent oxidoreductase n=1 Tax=Arthrobacter TaxID=1663 RepID=UPI001F45FFC0|nr:MULTISPECIES: NAD(P)H-dependent oxidoreductase [Arthrobacter]MDP9987658.1 glutathione-regulated potassium-efflux system ancillary protein KefG [Arthrobacter oryzae]UKA72048.1 NAD(P)H-dependent oxidoreductase [Arthrobacter sp. FW306-06-A]
MTTYRTLVVVAHPDLAGSRITADLADAIKDLDGVTVRDLASTYPDRHMDAGREQELLQQHDLVVLLFPWHWYSVPGLLKEWMDQVLTHGFAYGACGDALHGKRLQLVTSTGGPESSYAPTGHNRFTMSELLRPLEATAHLCGLEMAEPLILHGASRATPAELAAHAQRFRNLLSPVPAAPGG